MTPSSTQRCPKCHAEIPINSGYAVWCDLCEWNLYKHKTGRRENLYQKLYFDVSNRVGDRLLRTLINTNTTSSLQPTLTISKVMAFAIAGLAYILVLVQAVVGISLI